MRSDISHSIPCLIHENWTRVSMVLKTKVNTQTPLEYTEYPLICLI